MTGRKAASNFDMNGLKVTNLGAPAASSNDAVRMVDLMVGVSTASSRANHTGTQLAATISDFATAVRLNRVDQLAAPTYPVSFNAQRLTGLADPTAPQDGATRNYVDSALAALASGQTLKGTVRAVATSDVNIAAAPATIDGLTPVAGDVFLLTGQATATQNGPYVWTAAGAAMARAGNWDSAGEAVVGSYWIVREGTLGDKFALLANDSFTLGTTAGSFVTIGPVTLNVAVEADLGNGVATAFPIAHNYGTRAVNVVVYRNASPWDEVAVYVEHTDVNTVTIRPDAVWAAAEFHAVVSKM